jgi:hypothetical protein
LRRERSLDPADERRRQEDRRRREDGERGDGDPELAVLTWNGLRRVE